MDFQRLLKMQGELDGLIMEKHQFKKRSKMPEKALAFLVELSELANETRCFKYWSVKPPSETKVILDEYADGFHFLLSIGLDLGLRELDVKVIKCDRSTTEQFLKVFSLANDFAKDYHYSKYMALFSQYMALGSSLGFTLIDIEEAYIRKNSVNHVRQETDY